MLCTNLCFFQIAVILVDGIVFRDEKLGECPYVVCQNEGMLDMQTCLCNCGDDFYGSFCEKVRHISSWPVGPYLIPKPIFGCPDETFSTGSVNVRFRNESDEDMKSFLHNSSLIGPAVPGGFVWNFCKDFDDIRADRKYWWSGSYCIFQLADTICPEGLKVISVHVKYGYALENLVPPYPDIKTTDNGVQIVKVCCKQDKVTGRMLMPRNRPFYFLKDPSNSVCHDIFRMTVTEEDVSFLEWRYSRFSRKVTLCLYSPEPPECRQPSSDGSEYNGIQNTSGSGKPCLMWDEVLEVNLYPAFYKNNYCRPYPGTNIMGRPATLGCYVSNNLFEDCNIEECEGYVAYPVSMVQSTFNLFTLKGVSLYTGMDLHSHTWYQVDLYFNYLISAFTIYKHTRWAGFNYHGIIYVSKYPFDFLEKSALACTKPFETKDFLTYSDSCHKTLEGRYATLVPTANDANGVIINISLKQAATNCGKSLGLTTGRILDDQIQVSTETINFPSTNVRLYSNGGWCATETDDEPYVQIDLMIPTIVQGFWMSDVKQNEISNYPKKFQVKYGMRSDNLTSVQDTNEMIKFFTYTVEAFSEELYMFDTDILTRFLRIDIVDYHHSPCLKLELVGCLRYVQRKVKCPNSSIQFGFGVEPGKTLDLPLASNERSLASSDINDCIEKCKNSSNPVCNSIQFQNGSCLLRIPHRYNHHFLDKMVVTGDKSSMYGQVICIDGVVEETSFKREIYTTGSLLSSPSYPLYDVGVVMIFIITVPVNTYLILDILDLSISPSQADGYDRNEIKGNLKWNLGERRPYKRCSDNQEIKTQTNPTRYPSHMRIDYLDQDRYIGSRLRASTNALKLTFTTCFTSLNTPARGFVFNISYDEECGGCNPFNECPVTPQVCTDKCGYISSMNFPRYYQPARACQWSVEAPNILQNYVKLEILEFNVISTDETCLESSVTISGTNFLREKNTIGRYCNFNQPPSTIFSEFGKMTIEFDTTATRKTGTGFLLRYSFETVDQSIGEKETDEVCDEGWINYKQSCYKFYSQGQGISWVQAAEICRDNGGHLVCLESKQETQTIYAYLTTKWNIATPDVYIGLRKRDDQLRWENGNPLSYTSWEKDQPDGVGTENCVLMKKTSGRFAKSWQDVPCAYDQVNQFVCERRNSSQMHLIYSDIIINKEDPEFNERGNVFMCDNLEYVALVFACNGNKDCKDGSDENHCDFSHSCPNTSFTCQNERCVSRAFYCDFKDDCGDNSDEIGCVPRNCTSEEWQCNNNECITGNKRCNLVANCRDESDEENCDRCSNDSFQCYDGSCIPKSWVCDGQVDCKGNTREDELLGCSRRKFASCSDYYKNGFSNRGVYVIHQSANMAEIPLADENIAFNVICDFSHEKDIYNIFHHSLEGTTFIESDSPLQPKFQNDVRIIQHHYSSCEHYMRIESSYTDNVEFFKLQSSTKNRNCSCSVFDSCSFEQKACTFSLPLSAWYGVDEHVWLADTGYFHGMMSFLVFQGVENSNVKLTLGPLVCKEEKRRPEGVLCDNDHVISQLDKCLLVPDGFGQYKGCRDFTHLVDCENFTCPDGYYKCSKSYCIHISLVCDGKSDCLHNQDEINCGNYSCPGFLRCESSLICVDASQICDNIKDCPHGEDEILCDFPCPDSCTCTVGHVICRGDGVEDKIKQLSHDTKYLNLNYSPIDWQNLDLGRFALLEELHLSYTELKSIPQGMFIHQVNLYVLDLSYNRIKILGKGVFHGLQQLKFLNLIGNNVLHKLEAGAFEQLYSLTSLSLLNTKIEVLSADAFNGMNYLQNLTISTGLLNVVEDGAFKSLMNLRRLDMRKQNIQDFSGDIFLGLSRLKGLYTDSFILCCLKPESVTECLPEAGEFSSCDDLMRREELRVFMWILGLMALLGNFCVILYRLLFGRDGFRRGYGLFVANLGISDFLMGIYMVIIAGADLMFRGQYIWNDSWWRNSPYCQFAGALATMSSEASALFLCAITLDRYLVIKYPFGQFRINRLTTIILSCCIWLFSIIVAMVPILPGTGFTGDLYSRTGICLALPLTRERTPGWEFSTGIFIFFNFLTFALISLGQILMYRTIVKSSSIIQNKGRRSRDVQVAKNLSLIVLTDFICWFPVCCMGLMALSGTVINSEVYAWTAVFILPVNSAINPFLYTVTSFIGNKKIKKAAIQEAKAIHSTESASSVMIRKLKTLWDNPDLYFGSAALGDQVTTLKALLSSSELSASDILAIVEVVVRGLVSVHSQQLYFGNITEEDILIVINNKKILKTQLSAKLVLPDQECSKQPDDIYGVGKLLGRLLRRYATTRRA